jgi:hypothetical protein
MLPHIYRHHIRDDKPTSLNKKIFIYIPNIMSESTTNSLRNENSIMRRSCATTATRPVLLRTPTCGGVRFRGEGAVAPGVKFKVGGGVRC